MIRKTLFWGPALLMTLALCPGQVLEPQPHPLFDGDAVHDIWISFSQPDWWEQLRANFEGRDVPQYMEASFTWNEVSYERIGIRFKGNSSYNSYPGRKKSFKLKLNTFVKGQKIAGLDILNLHNAFKDPSFTREKVYYELARAAGLAAPRMNYAALHINNEYWGLYFLGEDVDSAFLESRFGNKEKGNLYSGEPVGTMQWRGPDVDPYRRMFEKENNEAADDWSDLIRLVEALNQTPQSQFRDAISSVLDVDSALTYLALDNLTVNLDSYIGSGHNYYLYHRQSDGRFAVMPWDPNEAFGNFNLGMQIDQLRTLAPMWTGGGAPAPVTPPGGQQPQPPSNRPLATRLWSVPEFREAYLRKLRDLMQGIAHPDSLVARMNALHDYVRPWVEADTQKMFSTAQFEQAMSVDTGGRPANQPPVNPPPPGNPPPPVNPQPGAAVPQSIPGLEPFVRGRSLFLQSQVNQLLSN